MTIIETIQNIISQDLKIPIERIEDSLLHFTYLEHDYYLFPRAITYAGNPLPHDKYRTQLPQKALFDKVLTPDSLFLLVGYNIDTETFVIWEPASVMSRLNKKANVSFYCNLKVLEKLGDEDVRIETEKLYKYVAFKRWHLTDVVISVKNLLNCKVVEEELPLKEKPELPDKIQDLIKYLYGADFSMLEILEIVMRKYGDGYPSWDYMKWRKEIIMALGNIVEE